jgi:D-lyxose ketol-isomerase
MKRSIINAHINDAKEFIARMRFALPPFAYWSPGEWKDKGQEYDEIRENQLGWDLTDFGSGDYDRNGRHNKPRGRGNAQGSALLFA